MNTEADAGERRYEEKWEKEEQLEAKERDLQQIEPHRRYQPCQNLDFGGLASELEIIHFCCSNHPVGATLLGQPQ